MRGCKRRPLWPSLLGMAGACSIACGIDDRLPPVADDIENSGSSPSTEDVDSGERATAPADNGAVNETSVDTPLSQERNGGAGGGGAFAGAGGGASGGAGGAEAGASGVAGAAGEQTKFCPWERPSTEVPLSIEAGRISCEDGRLGIAGLFSSFDDTGLSTISEPRFDQETGQVCVSVELGQVINEDYETTWGARLVLNLSTTDEDADIWGEAHPWPSAERGIGGLRFSASSVPSGTRVRFVVVVLEASYCQEPLLAGENDVNFADTALNCWLEGGATYSGAPIHALGWDLIASEALVAPFEFCVSNLVAVPRD